MGVIRKEGPRVDGEAALRRYRREPGDEVGAVRIVVEDGPPLEAAHHHMVKDPGGIEARLAWHSEGRLS
jgi:hypothetical protein